MTTKIRIENDANSNGDVNVRAVSTCEGAVDFTLFPGDARDLWITTSSALFVTETWPTKKPADVPVAVEPLVGPSVVAPTTEGGVATWVNPDRHGSN